MHDVYVHAVRQAAPRFALQEEGGDGFGLERIVLPFSSLAGWAIALAGVLTSLQVLQIHR